VPQWRNGRRGRLKIYCREACWFESGLGHQRVSTPDLFVRALALFNPQMKMLVKDLGKRNRVSSEKARRLLGFSPRPAATTLVECAESLLAR
jgi:hypothetical protein